MCKSALSVLVPIPAFLEPYVYFTPDHPEFGIDDQGRRCLAVDACMVPALQALWDREIPTISACCLHGAGEGVITLPRVIEPGETLPKPNWLQRDEALAQNAALLVEVAMLRAALAPEHGVSCQVCLECTGCGHEQDCALAAALAAPGEHGTAILAAADAMATDIAELLSGGIEMKPVTEGPVTFEAMLMLLQMLGAHRDDYRRLRGASAGAGQGAGEQGGEEITG